MCNAALCTLVPALPPNVNNLYDSIKSKHLVFVKFIAYSRSINYT